MSLIQEQVPYAGALTLGNNVLATSPTLGGDVTIFRGTGSSTIPALNITGGSGLTVNIMDAFATGTDIQYRYGRAATTGNYVTMNYTYLSANSAGNRFYIDLNGGSRLTLGRTVITSSTAFTATGLLSADGGLSSTTITASGLVSANAGLSVTAASGSSQIKLVNVIPAYATLELNTGASSTIADIWVYQGNDFSVKRTLALQRLGGNVTIGAGGLAVSGPISATDNVSFGGNLTVSGTLTSNQRYGLLSKTSNQLVGNGGGAVARLQILEWQPQTIVNGLTPSVVANVGTGFGGTDGTRFTSSYSGTVLLSVTYIVVWDFITFAGQANTTTVRKNGSLNFGLVGTVLNAGGYSFNSATCILSLAPGDYIEFVCENLAASQLSVIGNTYNGSSPYCQMSYYVLN